MLQSAKMKKNIIDNSMIFINLLHNDVWMSPNEVPYVSVVPATHFLNQLHLLIQQVLSVLKSKLGQVF